VARVVRTLRGLAGWLRRHNASSLKVEQWVWTSIGVTHGCRFRYSVFGSPWASVSSKPTKNTVVVLPASDLATPASSAAIALASSSIEDAGVAHLRQRSAAPSRELRSWRRCADAAALACRPSRTLGPWSVRDVSRDRHPRGGRNGQPADYGELAMRQRFDAAALLAEVLDQEVDVAHSAMARCTCIGSPLLVRLSLTGMAASLAAPEPCSREDGGCLEPPSCSSPHRCPLIP
jgi:hypothetical protein